MSKQYTIILGRSYGFFSIFVHIVQQLFHAQAEGRIPIIYWAGGIYFQKVGYNGVESRNIWDYFFEPVSDARMEDVFPWLLEQKHVNRKSISPDKIPSNVKIVDELCDRKVGEPLNCFRDRYASDQVCLNNMSLGCKLFVNKIVKKYVKIKPIVQQKIDAFYNEHFTDNHVLGVHLRGCSPVGLGHKLDRQFLKKIRKYKEPDCKIFIAIDNNKMLRYLEKKLRSRVVICCDALRAWEPHDLWDIRNQKIVKRLAKYRNMGIDREIIGAKPAEEALIDCILLSKCNFFLRSYSNMSAAVFFFNPYIESLFVPGYTLEEQKGIYLSKGIEE